MVNKQIQISTTMKNYNLPVHDRTYVARNDFYILHYASIYTMWYHHDILFSGYLQIQMDFLIQFSSFFRTKIIKIFTIEQHKVTTINSSQFISFLKPKSIRKEAAPIGIICVVFWHIERRRMEHLAIKNNCRITVKLIYAIYGTVC